MKHFPEQDWIDHARQVNGSEQRAAMQKHLDEGCFECGKTLELWRRIVTLTQNQYLIEPPDWAVRTVQASFSLRKLVPFPAGTLELASLLFDSALQPMAAAGVRGSAAFPQLLYKSGSVCIDMRVQPKPGSDSIILMGQLLDSSKPGHGIGGIPVSLLCEGDTVSRNQTNDLGEFDFGIDVLNHMQLVFGLEKSRTIVVPVPGGESSQDLA
jgi:hypothetical protein